MMLIADILLAAGAIGAGFYCLVLSRRLTRFNDLENGMGGAVAMLSVQVDDLKRALEQAKATAAEASARLEETTERAEETARRLELAMASSHDAPHGHGVPDGRERQVRRRRRGGAEGSVGEAA
ncbi:MAG: DUF6468 domain-containing protein [Paracoccaceae bacterium]|jgi:hypothetical protein|nr:DUF6468 domain-containing protein [Paracoccaceae bacterium]